MAVARGVELEYTDTWGRVHRASDATLEGIFAALGDASSPSFSPAWVVYEDEAKIEPPIPIPPGLVTTIAPVVGDVEGRPDPNRCCCVHTGAMACESCSWTSDRSALTEEPGCGVPTP